MRQIHRKRWAICSEDIEDVCVKRQCQRSTIAAGVTTYESEVVGVSPRLPVHQGQPTSIAVKRAFYVGFIQELERRIHGRDGTSVVMQAPLEPSSEELERMIYSANMHMTKKGRDIILTKPRMNDYTKRFFSDVSAVTVSCL